jgi:hypothetical protein
MFCGFVVQACKDGFNSPVELESSNAISECPRLPPNLSPLLPRCSDRRICCVNGLNASRTPNQEEYY